jgi:hypothetical protein
VEWTYLEYVWVAQGLHYARADFRDVIFVKTLTDVPPPEVRNWIRETGLGVDGSFAAYHPNGSLIRSDNYATVPLNLDYIAHAKTKLIGTAFTKGDTIQFRTSDSNPPSVVCRWIIRIR